MGNDEKIVKNSGKNKGIANLKPFEKGQTGNPNGRPNGQRNYATIYREALAKIAALEKITPDDLEDDMISVAVKRARKGDAVFYRDIMDRIHGKPVQPIGGDKNNPLTIQIVSYADSADTVQLQETN